MRKDQKYIHYMKIKLQLFSQLGGENINVYKKMKTFFEINSMAGENIL